MNVPAKRGTKDDDDQEVIIGRISGVYGVKGWVKVFSYSRPRENIFSYGTWLIDQGTGWQSRRILDYKEQGKNLLALIDDISDRDLAQQLVGLDVAIDKGALPELSNGEYYWCELIGMDIFALDGNCLGRIVDIQETGANDVLIAEGEQRYLVPLVHDEIVQEVDVENKRIIVDWNPEYI